MGNKSSLMLQDEEIKSISNETGFSPSQIEKLYSRFAHLDRSNCGTLTKNDLLSIPELAINPLCDRLIQMFFANCDPEDERINFKQFMKVLAMFNSTSSSAPSNAILPTKNRSQLDDTNNNNLERQQNTPPSIRSIHAGSRGKRLDQFQNRLNDNLRNKLSFVFRIYDADNDGRISFEDLKSILKMMVGNYIEDLQLDKIANRAFAEIDEDADGYIEFSEFCKVFSGKDLDDKLRVKFFN